VPPTPTPSATSASGTPQAAIRRATVADLSALVQLEHATFEHDRLSERQWHRHLHSDSAVVLAAARDRALAGAAVLFFRSGSRVARLYSIATAASARGEGIGTQLLDACERVARRRRCGRLRLEVRQDNLAAQRLYERHGYRRIASVVAYYEDGADAWRYEKTLA
jgi:[ribosomal protein S18]-alanine N-acetyltransferase